MSTDLAIFSNPMFGNVSVKDEGGNIWFVGKEIATVLGYSNTRDALSRHVDTEDKVVVNHDTPSGVQKMTMINESGMYSLVIKSKLDKAKKFKRWKRIGCVDNCYFKRVDKRRPNITRA